MRFWPLQETGSKRLNPGDYEPISLAEARRAVKIARGVRNEIRKLLPKEMLRK
jgi:hypothetical protein